MFPSISNTANRKSNTHSGTGDSEDAHATLIHLQTAQRHISHETHCGGVVFGTFLIRDPPPAAAGHNQKLFFAHGLSLIQRSRRASAASGEKVKKTLCTFPASSGWSYFCPFCQGHAKGVRCAKGQVLKALLEGRLDATGVELEGAGVELNVLEAQLRLRLLLVRDDAVMSPDEHWPVACRGVDEGAILGLLRCTTRTHSEEAQVLNLDLTARVAEVEDVRIGLRLVEVACELQ